ncbi:MAG TPA: hypothetical protein VNT50_10010 [Microbacterium sp.]|uniref:hypothetical protein n=1 Tax=Microbacterium sp. TaxID=51671 RepID=UPI002B95F221|nr:hypothetical protein [Microbacterium sp.]HWI31815.1 hypothetical protein [Microbacterium sp.]
MIVTDDYADDAAEGLTAPTTETEEPATQYGVGPFTVRELAILAAWLLAFVVSFFSISTGRFDSVWTSGLLWILTIGVPSVAVFLIVLRRFSPDGIRRVGSLGIDQFASVAFSVSAVLWLQLLWETIAIVVEGGPWLRGWVLWVELALMIALVVLTVFAPLIAPLSEDFQGRPEIVAHRNARPVRRVIARPRPERPAPEPAVTAGEPAAAQPSTDTGSYGTGAYTAAGAAGASASTPTGPQQQWSDDSARTSILDQASTETRAAAAPAHQAFWALVPEERDVVDERDIPIFRIGPTAWALVIEDRGETFVVRHEDGRIGYLHDVSGVTRG